MHSVLLMISLFGPPTQATFSGSSPYLSSPVIDGTYTILPGQTITLGSGVTFSLQRISRDPLIYEGTLRYSDGTWRKYWKRMTVQGDNYGYYAGALNGAMHTPDPPKIPNRQIPWGYLPPYQPLMPNPGPPHYYSKIEFWLPHTYYQHTQAPWISTFPGVVLGG